MTRAELVEAIYKATGLHRSQATAALTALCTLHPGVRALLSGEAVAVPRIATWEMCEAGRDAGSDEESWGGIYAAFISRSPYAQETPDAE
jgi:nucleoid DNA-binding protein